MHRRSQSIKHLTINKIFCVSTYKPIHMIKSIYLCESCHDCRVLNCANNDSTIKCNLRWWDIHLVLIIGRMLSQLQVWRPLFMIVIPRTDPIPSLINNPKIAFMMRTHLCPWPRSNQLSIVVKYYQKLKRILI